MIVRLSSVERSADETRNDVPEQPGEQSDVVARVWARVNVPAPVAKTFGTGEPGFVKATGRSPGASPPSAPGVLPGELPATGSARPVEISRPPRGPVGRLADRLRATSQGERLLALAVVFGIAFLLFVARLRSHP